MVDSGRHSNVRHVMFLNFLQKTHISALTDAYSRSRACKKFVNAPRESGLLQFLISVFVCPSFMFKLNLKRAYFDTERPRLASSSLGVVGDVTDASGHVQVRQRSILKCPSYHVFKLSTKNACFDTDRRLLASSCLQEVCQRSKGVEFLLVSINV